MTPRSMTGFGCGRATGRGVTVDVELSSVNRKQLDVRVSLPKGLAALESKLAAEISRVISRGAVGVVARIRPAASLPAAAYLDKPLAKSRIEALRRTARELGLPDDLSAASLAAMPDVMRSPMENLDAQSVWPPLLAATRKALRMLDRMRRTEGARLLDDILSRIAALEMRAQAIAARAPSVPRRHKAALQSRLRAAGMPLDGNDPALAKELALFADKCDIAEELTRLNSHVSQAKRLLRGGKPAGRPLDFLIQEMFREITTVGSKANDIVVSRNSVAFKTELERVREQVQNIE